MPENPWADFEQAIEDTEMLPPVTLKGEEFRFPKSPPALMRLRLANMARRHGGNIPTEEVVQLLTEVMDSQAFTRVLAAIPEDKLDVFLTTLLEQWDLVPKDQKENPTTEEVPTTESLSDSEPSKPTGEGSMAATSSTS